MSFEGYYQILCENGHYFEYDVYSNFGIDNYGFWKCPECNSRLAWYNLVDETNSEEEDWCDNRIDLECKKETEYCRCELCGDTHVKELPQYYIPRRNK